MSYERQLAVTRGEILDVYPVRRDVGLLNWPSFQTDARYPGGMSGGPVVGDGGLIVGAVCSGTKMAPYTSAATLLAALLVLHIPPVGDEVGPTPAVAELSGDDLVRVTGWDEVDVADTADGQRLIYTDEAVSRSLGSPA